MEILVGVPEIPVGVLSEIPIGVPAEVLIGVPPEVGTYCRSSSGRSYSRSPKNSSNRRTSSDLRWFL